MNIQGTEESSAVLSKLVEENLTVEAIVRLTFFLNAIESPATPIPSTTPVPLASNSEVNTSFKAMSSSSN